MAGCGDPQDLQAGFREQACAEVPVMESFPTTMDALTLRIAIAAAFILPLLLPLARSEEPPTAPGSKPQRLPLWPDNKAPVDEQTTEDGNAFITVHRAAHPNGTAVVICPGGGYGGLVVGPEGHGIAAWLNAQGITGVVLEYRLPRGRSFVPLHDVQRAIRVVRARAGDWQCDPQRIGIMGFSAGGHLASTAATHFTQGQADATDPVERQGCRPDFAILVYPVISMGEAAHPGSKRNLLGSKPSAEMINLFSNEKQVTAETPPTYLAHAIDDGPVPCANSRGFYAALKEHDVAAEYLELPSGGHGLNGYRGPMWDAWQRGSMQWLAAQKLIPEN